MGAHGLQKKQNQHRVRDPDIAASNLTNYFKEYDHDYVRWRTSD